MLGWTPYQYVVALLMVVTGSLNTLTAKWANQIPAINSIGAKVPFNHPFLQSTAMFVGEFACLFAFYIQLCYLSKRAKQGTISENGAEQKELKKFTWKNCYLLIPASVCDMAGTSLMYVGLTFTSASSFQMLRGAVIIFTGFNSMIFLKRRLDWFKWVGMAVIFVGLVTVGLADLLYPTPVECYSNTTATTTISTTTVAEQRDDDVVISPLEPLCGDSSGSSDEITGDAIIICAQIIVSFQMVYEEKVLNGYTVAPLEAVGWEGFFGFVFMCIVLLTFGYIDTGSKMWGHSPLPPWILEDAVDGLIQIGNEQLLALAISGTIISIAFFNFAGVSVTRELSATTRMVLDSVRTLVIWIFSVAIGWQSFQYLQPIGFVVLLIGMSLYNDILIMPYVRKWTKKEKETRPAV